MHLTASLLTTLLTLATSTSAISNQTVRNNCNEAIFVTYINSTKSTTGPLKVNGTGGTWDSSIIGVGNSLGVSKNDQFWSNETPKLILGSSTDRGVLYWTVSNVDGNPFDGQKFRVGSGEKNNCESADNFDTKVHGCQDDNVALTLTLC
ncbi:hypothetical protein Q7P37_009362 [Cladosporium fusiforme]